MLRGTLDREAANGGAGSSNGRLGSNGITAGYGGGGGGRFSLGDGGGDEAMQGDLHSTLVLTELQVISLSLPPPDPKAPFCGCGRSPRRIDWKVMPVAQLASPFTRDVDQYFSQ